MKHSSVLGPVEARWFSGTVRTSSGQADMGGWGVSRGSELHTGRTRTGRGVGLGGLFALGPSDGFDGAQGSVEPGLLGGLNLIESLTQMVLQVLKTGTEMSHCLDHDLGLLQGIVGKSAHGSDLT